MIPGQSIYPTTTEVMQKDGQRSFAAYLKNFDVAHYSTTAGVLTVINYNPLKNSGVGGVSSQSQTNTIDNKFSGNYGSNSTMGNGVVNNNIMNPKYSNKNSMNSDSLSDRIKDDEIKIGKMDKYNISKNYTIH